MSSTLIRFHVSEEGHLAPINAEECPLYTDELTTPFCCCAKDGGSDCIFYGGIKEYPDGLMFIRCDDELIVT